MFNHSKIFWIMLGVLMYRFKNIRNVTIIASVIVLFLCFLATSSFSITKFPIDGNKKIDEPEVTPYWDMGEPGHDPFGRINTLSSSGACSDLLDSDRVNDSPVAFAINHDFRFTLILKSLILRMNFSIFRLQPYNDVRSQ